MFSSSVLAQRIEACDCSAIHPWSPDSCVVGTAHIFRSALRNSAPMYMSLHALAALLKMDYRAIAAQSEDIGRRRDSARRERASVQEMSGADEGRLEEEAVGTATPGMAATTAAATTTAAAAATTATATATTTATATATTTAAASVVPTADEDGRGARLRRLLRALARALRKALLQVAVNTAHSSLFLSGLAASIIASVCALRRIFGTLYVCNFGALPGLLASWSLVLEKRSRRHDLAVYVANITVRVLFRKLQQEGVVHAIPDGERLVAFVSLFTLLTAQRQHWSHQGKLMKTILQVVASDDEASEVAGGGDGVARTADGGDETVTNAIDGTVTSRVDESEAGMVVGAVTTSGDGEEDSGAQLQPQHTSAWQKLYRAMTKKVALQAWVQRLLEFRRPRDSLCTHRTTCAASITNGVCHGLRLGAGALLATVAAKLLLGKNLHLSPRLVVVLVTTTPLLRALRCALRHKHRRSAPALQSAVVSAWMAAVFNTGLAHYIMGRAAEAFLASHITVSHYVPTQVIDAALFALSAMVIVHFAVAEPTCLPTSYFRFLDRMTSGARS
ncbi:hypothetical protein PTSG_06989 [Salpingoeca rosetta]|uniref:Transmembrane protein 135 N-terminal domain-containing protein n=1 Tax=Salpingoeca rosetta (strain ATCC 50818 / BSB-021) TaxID=946362 RepID=F2UFE0_SALR5|nr:uncharacterized protein PTSG_06989 [Salpingoeca rosetta]EGD75340.1 hypothetical protein PTSG_06989 [Salpingoeca rosetta]|eukprot:XP_004992393.1 hypothetical protein PTSG_06989 [Salpingoeca rosetta]